MKTIELDQNNRIIEIDIQPLPYSEEFIEWGKSFLSNNQLQAPIDVSEGADRHMLVFTFNSVRFSLNYESYSESIWIAPEEAAAEPLLVQLQSYLS